MSEYDKCLVSAKKSLAMREHSKFQLTNKLKNKGFNVDIINNVLEDLSNSKFQSDERYTEEYIRYRQNSGYGLEKIIYELKSNGISSDLIDINLCKFTDDYDVLFEFAKFKTRDKNLEDQKVLARYVNNFKARGFDSSIILKVIENIKSYEK
jgi:regulatory protein